MRKTKKSISLILAIFMLLALAMTASAAPTLDAGGYYLLSTADDMVWFRDQVAAGNVDINAKLMDDIDLTRVAWQPIWYEALYEEQEFNFATEDSEDMPYWYGGTFDGNGMTIKIDTYNNSTFSFPANVQRNPNPIQAGGGLFMGISDAAVVKNLTLTGKMTLAGFPTVADVRIFASPLVAKNRGTIYNVTVEDFTVENNGLSSTSIIGLVSCLSYGGTAIIDGCAVDNSAISSAAQVGQKALITGQVGYSGVVRNSSVSGSLIENSAGGAVGGITSLCFEGGSISNCSVSGVDLKITVASVSGFTSGASCYLGGIAGQSRGSENDSAVEPYTASILNCSVSDSTFTMITEDDYALISNGYIGGIVGMARGSTLGAPSLVQNCVVSDITINGTVTNYSSVGGIVGHAFNTQILQCQAEEITQTLRHTGAYTSAGVMRASGIAGIMTYVDDTATENQGKVVECVVNGLSIEAGSTASVSAVTYFAGAIAGDYQTLAGLTDDHLVQNCAAIGTINFDVETNNSSGNACTAYIGGLIGRNYAKSHENMMGYFTVTSADTQGTTDWYIGALTGYLVGRDDSSLRAELVDNLYDDEITLALYGRLGTTANRQYIDPNLQATFDGDDLDNAATLFASFFKGGELELTAGQTLDLELEAFAGTAGIDLSAASWSSSDPSVVSVSPATGANVTISALEAGTATITCTFTLNGAETTQSVTIVVPGTPDYVDAEAEITGTPSDGTIYPGEEVNLTYDFSPYTAIPEIDNSGMDGSGLLAAIVDGKVVLTGTAETPGTYSYVVKLQGTDGSIITQTVSVVIQSGSSRHLQGRAADVRVPAERQEAFSDLALQCGFTRAILYGPRNFVHLEV